MIERDWRRRRRDLLDAEDEHPEVHRRRRRRERFAHPDDAHAHEAVDPYDDRFYERRRLFAWPEGPWTERELLFAACAFAGLFTLLRWQVDLDIGPAAIVALLPAIMIGRFWKPLAVVGLFVGLLGGVFVAARVIDEKDQKRAIDAALRAIGAEPSEAAPEAETPTADSLTPAPATPAAPDPLTPAAAEPIPPTPPAPAPAPGG